MVRMNLDINTQDIVTDFSPNSVGGSLEISSDGNTLFVARTDRADFDLQMIDLSE